MACYHPFFSWYNAIVTNGRFSIMLHLVYDNTWQGLIHVTSGTLSLYTSSRQSFMMQCHYCNTWPGETHYSPCTMSMLHLAYHYNTWKFSFMAHLVHCPSCNTGHVVIHFSLATLPLLLDLADSHLYHFCRCWNTVMLFVGVMLDISSNYHYKDVPSVV